MMRAVIFGIFLGALLFFVPFVIPFVLLFFFFMFCIRFFFLGPWRRGRWRYDRHYDDTIPIDGGYYRSQRDPKAPMHNITVL